MSLFSSDETNTQLELLMSELQDLAHYVHDAQDEMQQKLITLASLTRLRDGAWQKMIGDLTDRVARLSAEDQQRERHELGADDHS